MEPGRKMEFQACEPVTLSARSEADCLALYDTGSFDDILNILCKSHAIAVAVGRYTLLAVAFGRRFSQFAQDDDACGAAVNAKGAAGAHIVVNREDHMVAGVGSRLFCADGFVNGLGGNHVNTLPRADVNAALAHDALGLVDVNELLRFDGLRKPVGADFLKDVVLAKLRQWGIGVSCCHVYVPFATSGTLSSWIPFSQRPSA